MQVPSPLVATPVGNGGSAPAPVANAPGVRPGAKHETARPVTASKDSDRAPPDSESRRAARRRGADRGGRLDVLV